MVCSPVILLHLALLYPDSESIIEHVLSPQDGPFSIVNFYTTRKQPSLHEKVIGGINEKCGWLSRGFWQIWFDFERVCPEEQRTVLLFD